MDKTRKQDHIKKSDKIIELKNINKIYGEKIKTQVLYDINIGFEANSFNSIIGESGSGKSTLLNIIGTLDKPSSGEVYIGGKRTDTMNTTELSFLRNRTIGFIFQFHYLLPEFTAKENVLIPYKIHNYKVPREVDEWAEELLNFVGLIKLRIILQQICQVASNKELLSQEH